MNTLKLDAVKETIRAHRIKFIVLIIMLLGVVAAYLIGYNYNKEAPAKGAVQFISSFSEVNYDFIHKMTNSVIVADDKWGDIQVNKENIQKVKESAVYKSDEEIQAYIAEWESGNFNNSHNFHNYVWKKLGGTIGRASDIDKYEAEKAKNRLVE